MWRHLNQTTRIIIGLTVAVLIWISGVLIGQEQAVLILNPQGGWRGFVNRDRIIQVSLMLDFGDGQIKVFPEPRIKYGESVFNLLKSLPIHLDTADRQAEPAGQIIDLTIDGYVSDPQGKQWLVWLNNQLQSEDLSQIRLKSGDIIELKYIKLKQIL